MAIRAAVPIQGLIECCAKPNCSFSYQNFALHHYTDKIKPISLPADPLDVIPSWLKFTARSHDSACLVKHRCLAGFSYLLDEIEAGVLPAVKDMDLRRRLFDEVPGAEGRWHAAHEQYVDELEAEADRGSLPEALLRARRALEFLPPGEALLERAAATLERLKAEDAELQLPAWTEVCVDVLLLRRGAPIQQSLGMSIRSQKCRPERVVPCIRMFRT